VKNRKPLKNVKVGDKVKTTDLLKNQLFTETKLMQEVKKWTVAELNRSAVTVKHGKKTVQKRKTILVLKGKRNKKEVTCRTYWIE
jgi:hypothetical protein